MMNVRLSFQIYTMELRKMFAYRSDFWLSFVVSTMAQFVVAWFLWRSIFAYKTITHIGNYSFTSLMFYYLLVPIIGRTVYGGNMGDVATEIYQGSLTRYLVYPVSFFRYKMIVYFANASILLLQLFIVIGIVRLLLPAYTTDYAISLVTMLQGTLTIAFSTLLYFIFSSTIQLIAFWADSVWSLSAILRFITGILGGSLIPLSLFPEKLQPVLTFLPFSCFVHLPVQAFLGRLPADQWYKGMAVIAAWGVVCSMFYALLWARGNRQYAGVGI